MKAWGNLSLRPRFPFSPRLTVEILYINKSVTKLFVFKLKSLNFLIAARAQL